MRVETKTCPFTGLSFGAVFEDDRVVITNPLTREHIAFHIEGDMLIIPLKELKRIYTLSPSEAAQELEVTRQRIDQLVKSKKLHPAYIGQEMVFLEDDVIEYKSKRKNGRPRKE